MRFFGPLESPGYPPKDCLLDRTAGRPVAGMLDPYTLRHIKNPYMPSPNVPLLRALWHLIDGIGGLLKGSWGALVIKGGISSLRTWVSLGTGGQASPTSPCSCYSTSARCPAYVRRRGVARTTKEVRIRGHKKGPKYY